MANATAQSGTSSYIEIRASEIGYNAAGNYSDVAWEFYLWENGGSNAAWNSGVPFEIYTVGVNGTALAASGTFAYDWRPAGNQGVLIANGTTRFPHYADGNYSIYVQGNIGDTGSQSAGGPTAIGVNVPATVTKVPPGTPTSLGATRVSDTQHRLTWAQTSASNGQPLNNDIQSSINGGAFGNTLIIGAANAATVGSVANRKTIYRVRASNQAGVSGWSANSAPVYTTPADPTNATAVKNTGLDIIVGFTSNVAYTEHEHEVWHGTVAGGTTTWDAAPLTTLASGVTSYTHVAPDASKVHTYRVRAKAAGPLYSGYAATGNVQLLAPPNKPAVPAMDSYADKALALTFSWVHNPIDTTPQTAYEFATSTDGGATWATTGKVASSAASRTIAANAYAAGVALTTRVRTWGSAATAGSDGTGASPWSDVRTVTYKTAPTATITSPANGTTLNDATLRANLGFAQTEGATFVKAQLELIQAGSLVEARESTLLLGITFDTPVQNGLSYTVRARVQDSNGLWSAWASNTFSVTYLAPVPADVTVSFLPETGFGQLNLLVAAPGAGQSAATLVTITRKINGVEEVLVKDYPIVDELAFLDTTAVTHGTNIYTITTTSALGAQTTVTKTLVTEECRRAYLSKGEGFGTVTVFGGNLSVSENLDVASSTLEAAGRLKPIGLYGIEQAVQLKVSSFIFDGFGSSRDELRAILLTPGKACFRDATGRRIFGSVKGSVKYEKASQSELSFTLTETS